MSVGIGGRVQVVGEAEVGDKIKDAKATTDMSDRKWSSNDKIFWATPKVYDKLPAGVYRGEITSNGPVLIKQTTSTDDLLELPDAAVSEIIAEFEKFWEVGDRLKLRGYLRKRGFLLWGPPGSGKTSCVHLMIRRLVNEMDGLIFLVDHPHKATACISMLRDAEPERPLIAVIEDLEELVDEYGESDYLSLLDGEAQVDRVVYVATTNFPEQLDKRFVNRPSRFDTVKFIGMPNEESRRIYLREKEPSLTEEELEEWTSRTEGYSVAHLKELIIAVKCLDHNLGDVIERLDDMRERQPTSDSFDGNSFGFTPKKKRNKAKNRDDAYPAPSRREVGLDDF